ncbi:MAG: hypothetical protein ABIH83_04975 [Candidatus Micrarchaeota archaeon]
MGFIKNPLLFAFLALSLITLIILSIYTIYLHAKIDHLTASYDSQVQNLTSRLGASQAELSSLQADYQSSQAELYETKTRLENTQKSLDEKTGQLSGTLNELSATQENLSQTEEKLRENEQRVGQIRSELNTLEQDLDSSMSWFRENSELPEGYSWNVDIFKERILSDCVDSNELNLACINYLNERTVVQIEYKSDISAGQEDHLQSIKETINREGGDCEDYALFFKALLNSIKNSYDSDLYVKAWTPGTGEFRVWPKNIDAVNYYYYANADAVLISNLKNSYPYVVCYSVDGISGHCRVAISEYNITQSSELSLLEGAHVFEPQTGKFGGTIGYNYDLCDSSKSECYSTPGTIIIVISDDDIYQMENENWVSYSGYLLEISEIRGDLS